MMVHVHAHGPNAPKACLAIPPFDQTDSTVSLRPAVTLQPTHAYCTHTSVVRNSSFTHAEGTSVQGTRISQLGVLGYGGVAV